MGIPINKKAVYEARYPAEIIVELTEPIDDPYTPKSIGARFRVDSVDDAFQLHGSWLPPNRGSMAIDIEYDHFKIVSDDEN